MQRAAQGLRTPLTGAGQQFFVWKIPEIVHGLFTMNGQGGGSCTTRRRGLANRRPNHRD
jgi:hypothetical protein